MPAISVLMPCYNVSPTVDEAISSLMGQSLTDFELVAVDDGSSDDTLTHLQEWAEHDQRIKVLPLHHQGIINSLNAGLGACRSDLIARMDADDRSCPNRLSRQVDYLNNHPEIVIVSSLVKGFPENKLGNDFRDYIHWLNSLLTHDEIKRAIYIHSPLAHPSVTFRQQWVDRVGGYQDHGWAEDYDLWLRLSLIGAKFAKLPEVLLEWRDHPRRLTHTDNRYSMESDLRLKAHYLIQGPLSSRDGVFIWGMDRLTRQLAGQLISSACPLIAFVNSKQNDKEHTIHSVPIISSEIFTSKLHEYHHPAVLIAENNLKDRTSITQHLTSLHMQELVHWWVVE